MSSTSNHIQNPSATYCMECSAQLKGRSDKKFCNSDCRISYHNRANRNMNQHIREINIILKRNRKILAEYLSMGRKIAFEQELLKMNFNFNFYTQVKHLVNNGEWRYCYELAYRKIDQRTIEISAAPELKI